MTVVSRLMTDPNDFVRIDQWVMAHPDRAFHVVDMAYRLCSPAAQNPENVRLWEDEAGLLVGFVVVQQPFATLDCSIDPAFDALRPEMIGWGVERLHALAQERGSGFGFLIDALSDDPIAVAHGFTLDDWHIRHLMQPLTRSLPEPDLPDGFAIRPLAGLDEAETYVNIHRAAFGSQNMTLDWRQRIIRHPRYQPQLDLVAVNAADEPVAFCIGWLCEVSGELRAQIEPLGVLPDYQAKGLGRALLRENLRRMQAAGAVCAYVDAESYNPASQALYLAEGFAEEYQVIKYFARFEPAES